MSGILYIVATPIGNLGDISERAIDTLREVSVVACEDTRHTGKLLKHLDLKKKLVSLHDHNEQSRKDRVVELLESGESVALVSDAGMPLISDPGYQLVNAVRDSGIKITVIPGASAFVSAAVLSGLPTDAIYFGGVLPSKTGARKKALTALASLDATLVFYESPKRLVGCLRDCEIVLGGRQASVVRELTKLHEETQCGSLPDLRAHFEAIPPRGEIVLLIDRQPAVSELASFEREPRLVDLVTKYEAEGIDRKTALKKAEKEVGYSKSEAYRIMMQHRQNF